MRTDFGMFELAKNNKSTDGIDESVFEDFAKAGIKAIEVTISFLEHKPIPWDKLVLWSEKYGVKLWSFHLPFMKADIASLDDEYRISLVAKLSEYIKNAAAIGIKTIVIHPSYEPYSEDERAMRMEQAKKSLKSLAESAQNEGVRLAVENLPRTCLGRNSDEIMDLISAHPELKVCFDTNHLLDESSDDFIEKLGDKIVTIHVSDYDFKNERHWFPGEGKIDWIKLINKLKEVEYKGPFLYEIAMETPPSIQRRRITYFDFADNYNSLMSGVIPSPIGTPIDSVCCHWTKAD